MIKALGRQQLDISVFSELCRCYLQVWDLTISFFGSNNSLGSSVGSLEVPWSPFCQQLNEMQLTPRPVGCNCLWEMSSWGSVSLMWQLHLDFLPKGD